MPEEYVDGGKEVSFVDCSMQFLYSTVNFVRSCFSNADDNDLDCNSYISVHRIRNNFPQPGGYVPHPPQITIQYSDNEYLSVISFENGSNISPNISRLSMKDSEIYSNLSSYQNIHSELKCGNKN